MRPVALLRAKVQQHGWTKVLLNCPVISFVLMLGLTGGLVVSGATVGSVFLIELAAVTLALAGVAFFDLFVALALTLAITVGGMTLHCPSAPSDPVCNGFKSQTAP